MTATARRLAESDVSDPISECVLVWDFQLRGFVLIVVLRQVGVLHHPGEVREEGQHHVQAEGAAGDGGPGTV